jgi:hypothetical protein
MSDTLEGIARALRETHPFHNLPATSQHHQTLWTAYNRTLLALRLPLYHNRLGKPRPKQTAYDEAIQMGLALLAAFAHHAGTHQAIVRIDGNGEAISFQPRPWAANWTAQHALSPEALQDAERDPLTQHGQRPQVSTADIVHLPRLVALAFIKAKHTSSHRASGTATFEFYTNNWDQPSTRLCWRPYGSLGEPTQYEILRDRT